MFKSADKLKNTVRVGKIETFNTDKRRQDGPWGHPVLEYFCEKLVELRTGGYEGLSGFVAFVLVEVLYETSCKVLCFLLPY